MLGEWFRWGFVCRMLGPQAYSTAANPTDGIYSCTYSEPGSWCTNWGIAATFFPNEFTVHFFFIHRLYRFHGMNSNDWSNRLKYIALLLVLIYDKASIFIRWISLFEPIKSSQLVMSLHLLWLLEDIYICWSKTIFFPNCWWYSFCSCNLVKLDVN